MDSSAVKIEPTHFKYVCRVCLTQHMQPILQADPPSTPIPKCCGRDRDMAYQGVTTLENSSHG